LAFAGAFLLAPALLAAALRPAFLRAAPLAAALRFLAAGRARRFAAARLLPFFAAAERRFIAFALPGRAAFLRPERLDFDFDPVRAIEPP
jgi:hypothetical protein